jgi:hypothetical protein
MNKMIIGIDVSKNDLDVAFWQNDKSFFLGKYPNNQGALGGIRGNNPLRAFYQRLVGKDKKAKVAIVASARKIIVWCWAVFRQNLSFDSSRFENVS